MSRGQTAAVAALIFTLSFAGSAFPQPPPAGQPEPAAVTSPPPSAGADGVKTPAVGAGEPPLQPPTQEQIDELRRRIEVLAAELERLRSGEVQEAPLDDARRRALGLAPSAAAAYRKSGGLSFAGYGEMLYENFGEDTESGVAAGKASQIDFLRLILYSGYRFGDRVIFNSEIELEHANEISVEFAYLDFMVHDVLILRGGMLLVPMGLVNEFHEPTVFLGARRPETESRILPSTWRENGAGVLGSVGPVAYRAFVINGLNAGGFSAAGLRGGRQKGSRARADDLALVGRVDVTPMPGVMVGGSFYTGGSDQSQYAVGGRSLDVGTHIGELHGQIQWRGTDVRALYARASVDDVAGLNQALGLTGRQSIGEAMTGGYVQVGHNVLSQLTTRTWLTPYYRFERVDTQADVPAGFSRDPARDGTFHTLGLELKPIPEVVVKLDYQWVRNRARTGVNQFNIALGYAF